MFGKFIKGHSASKIYLTFASDIRDGTWLYYLEMKFLDVKFAMGLVFSNIEESFTTVVEACFLVSIFVTNFLWRSVYGNIVKFINALIREKIM